MCSSASADPPSSVFRYEPNVKPGGAARACRRITPVIVFALLVGCTPRVPPHASSADAERANVELAELEQGRDLVVRKCAGCHKTPMPKDHSPAEWPKMIGEMADRSNLDFKQTKLIEKYLIVMSKP